MDGVCVYHSREYVPLVTQGLMSMLTLTSDMKFILLHETKNDDGIRSFFHDVWELYLKVSHLFRVFDQTMIAFADNVKSVPHGTFPDTQHCI